MKALFIWREESKNYIKRIIGENQFTDGVNFITSQSSFDAFIPKSKENLTTAEKKEETKKENVFKSYTKIYILAELGWDKNKLFDGYEKGFDIIDKWKTKIPPHIEFFSIANQKLVSQSVSDKFRFIVKAFPFTNLLKLDSKYIFNTENMNQYKWDYFSYQILTSYGILDNFSHRLDIINDTNPNFQILLDELVGPTGFEPAASLL